MTQKMKLNQCPLMTRFPFLKISRKVSHLIPDIFIFEVFNFTRGNVYEPLF